MAEEPKPDDIKDILADLDAILSGLTPDAKKTEAAPEKTPAVEPAPAPKPVEPPQPKIPGPAAQKPSPAKPPEPEIEKGPRTGVGRPPEAAPPPKPALMSQPAGAVKPPMEIDIGAAKAAPKVEVVPPAPARPPEPALPKAAEPAPDPAIIKSASPAAGMKTAFEIRPPLESNIPPDVPKEQIRRVAFVYVAVQEAKFYEFVHFLDSVALNVSKKPLFINKSLIVKVNPDGADFAALLEKVKGSQAMGVVGVLTGMPWSKTRDLQEVFKGGDLFFRSIEGDDVLKRSAVVDLIVELMLLGPG